MIESDEQTVFGNSFLLQNPIEILTIPIPKGEKEARLGNITITASQLPYIDQKGERQYIYELPASDYDRKIFNHLIKLVRNGRKSRTFEFTDSEEILQNSATHTDSIRLYEPLKLSILRWYCVTLSIPDYLYIVKDTKEFKKIPMKLIRVISGIQVSPQTIQFDISETFSHYVLDQDFLHKMSPAAPNQKPSMKTPVPTGAQPVAPVQQPQQHHEIKEVKRISTLSSKINDAIDYIQLFHFLNKWIQQKRIKISIIKLIERLGLLNSHYENQPTRFLSDLNQACKKISQKTFLNVLIEAEKKYIPERQKEEYAYVKFELTVKEENLENYRNQVKRELGTGMYRFFAKSVDTLISEANLMNNKPDKLVYLMEYAFLNRKENNKPNTPAGSIENPVDYVHRELHKKD